MAFQTLNITLEFLQNQLDDTSFGYTIINNGNRVTYTGVTYTGTVDTVNKTFRDNSNSSNGNLMSFDLDLTPNITDNAAIAVGFNGPVNVIKQQSDGKYICVGGFTSYQGQTLSQRKICRLNTDFSLDVSFSAPDFATDLPTLEIDSSDRIYLGSSNTIGGKGRLQRLNPDGSLDTSYVTIGFDRPVTAIKLDANEKLIVAGVFTTFNGTARKRIVRLTTSGIFDTTFSGVTTGFASTDDIPRTIDIQSDGNIVVGGDFYSYNGFSCGNIIILAPSGAVAKVPTDLDNAPSGTYGGNVLKVLVDSTDRIYVSGKFERYGGGPTCNKIIRLYKNSFNNWVPDTTFAVITDGLQSGTTTFTTGGFNMILNSNNNLVVVGNFNKVQGDDYSNIAVLSPTGTISPDGEFGDGTFTSTGAPVIYTLLEVDGRYIVGGTFYNYINPNVYEDQYTIPISTTSDFTQTNTFNNLSVWNKNDNVVYSESGNVITVAYTYDDSETVLVSNVYDIPDYLIIRIDGDNIPPQLVLDYKPQSLTPAYNPITFGFSSLYSTQYGFRYLVDLYNETTNDLIASFKIAPQIDDTGYIDLSKIISNACSVDFDPNSLLTQDAKNSYINFKLELGGEYREQWLFNDIISYSGASVFSGYTNYTQSNLIAHSYVVGDNISIDSNSTNVIVNGLHKVVEVPDQYSIVVDLKFPSGPISGLTGSISGTTLFADNRKTSYPNLVSVTGLTAFNGARTWMDFINWKGINYTIVDVTSSSRNSSPKFLTDLPLSGFSMTPTQDMWLDFFNENPLNIKLKFITDTGVTGETATLSGIHKVIQVGVGPNQLGIDCNSSSYEFYLTDETNLLLSKVYKINIDTRTKIEDYEILFMDRMGSLVSYAFQLRANVKGTVERETYKQAVNYKLNQDNYLDAYDVTGRGSAISNVSVIKDYELNTNWMSDEMSVYFEQLVTSPYTWIKIDGIYYACIVNEKDFEVTRQKNKNLIKKMITVRLSNDNVINI